MRFGTALGDNGSGKRAEFERGSPPLLARWGGTKWTLPNLTESGSNPNRASALEGQHRAAFGRKPDSPRFGRNGVLALGLLLPVVWGVYRLTGSLFPGEDPRITVFGTFLGMTVGDVRQRFSPGQEGEWTSSTRNEDFVLEWAQTEAQTIGDATSGIRQATFEFHEGLLVAIRAEVSPASPLAEGAGLEIHSVSVLHRSVHDDRVRVSLLSRTCPTHHEEVQALLEAP